MSKMSDLILDIQEHVSTGIMSFGAIAERYNVPREFVENIYDDMCDSQIDCDDSDDGYALASAGMGTDEDYGYTAED